MLDTVILIALSICSIWIACTDLKRRVIANKITIPLFGSLLLTRIVEGHFLSYLPGFLLTAVLLFVIAYFTKGGIGGGDIIAEEWLCRPMNQSVMEFFDTSDAMDLWEREAATIEAALQMKSSHERMINITISSLPYFLQRDWTWQGGIELVEWGPISEEARSSLCHWVRTLKARGLKVWVDDLVPEAWRLWKDIEIDGFKIDYDEIFASPTFTKYLQTFQKPIIAEKIESEHIKKQVMNTPPLSSFGA